jgi:two-component system sensor histidine kinase TctE
MRIGIDLDNTLADVDAARSALGRRLGDEKKARILEWTDRCADAKAKKLAGGALLEVIDSGPGLEAAQRERLFQPFSAAGPQAGSGLGLAICREIVAPAGGRIRLDARDNGPGLAARVWLPRSAAA